MWIGAEVRNVRIEGNTVIGPGIFHGDHHAVHPLQLEALAQPLLLEARPTPDKPKF